MGNKEGFCKNLTVRKMEAHRKEARRDFNRLGERIAHPKNFQRENQSRGKLESTFLVTILARTEVSRPKKAAKKANKTRRFY